MIVYYKMVPIAGRDAPLRRPRGPGEAARRRGPTYSILYILYYDT